MAERRVLVIQFRIREGDTLADFHAIEDVIVQAFAQNNFAKVDGHDVGGGVFNLYVYPRAAWGPVIERVHAFLKHKGWLDRAIIAKGLASGKWQVIWPEGFAEAFQL